MPRILDLTAETALASDDQLVLWNTSGADTKKVSMDVAGIPAPNVYRVSASAVDQGAAATRSIKTFVDAIGTSQKATIVCGHTSTGNTTTYTLTTSETIPSNITLIMEPGAILDGAGTLTINGPFEAGLTQCFGTSITIIFGSGAVKEVHAVWWGFLSSASAAVNIAALQKCVNVAATSGHVKVELPYGKFDLGDDLYLDYDATNNPGWPSTAAYGGRIIVNGHGWHDQNNRASYPTGTVLNFSTGYGIKAGDGTSTGNRLLTLQNFSVWGDNTTQVVHLNYVTKAVIRNLFIDQDGTGDGLVCFNAWGLSIDQVEAYGAGTGNGIGIHIYNDVAAGGYNIGRVKGRNFQRGILFGETSTGVGIRSIAASFLDGSYCAEGIVFGSVVTQSAISTIWGEGNTTCGIRIFHNAAGINFGAIYQDNSSATEADIVLGLSGGSAVEKGHKDIRFDHISLGSVNVAGVKRYSSAQCGSVKILSGSLAPESDGVGIGIDLANEVQYGIEIGHLRFGNLATEINNVARVDYLADAGTLGQRTQRSPLDIYQTLGIFGAVEIDTEHVVGDLVLTGAADEEVAYYINATAAARAVTLPAATTKRLYFFKKSDVSGNAVTINPAGADTIDGAASHALAAQYNYALLLANGVAIWMIVSSG